MRTSRSVAALVTLLLASGCEESPPPAADTKPPAAAKAAPANPPAPAAQAPSADAPPATTVATRDSPPANVWPFTPGKGVELADDLLAENYYVVFDGSGSMSEQGCSGNQSKAQVAVEAVSEFAAAVPKEANLGLMAFDSRGIQQWVPLGTENREAFVQQVKATRVGGATPLRRAIERGYQTLTLQAQRQAGYGEYNLVVVTDGMPDPASENPAKIVEDMLRVSPVVLHTIGFCIGERHALNQPGRTIYRAANDPAELRAGLQAVLAEAESFSVSEF